MSFLNPLPRPLFSGLRIAQMWPTPAPSCIISLYETACVLLPNDGANQPRRVGNDLRKPVFARGHLYCNVRRLLVRVISSQHINVLLPHDSQRKNMQNVVYNEVRLDR